MNHLNSVYYKIVILLIIAFGCGLGAVIVDINWFCVLMVLIQLFLLAYAFLSFFASFTKEWKLNAIMNAKKNKALRLQNVCCEAVSALSTVGILLGSVFALLFENDTVYYIFASISLVVAIIMWRVMMNMKKQLSCQQEER